MATQTKMREQLGTRSALLVTAVAVGVSSALVLGHAADPGLAAVGLHLTNAVGTVIAAGGKDDPFGANVARKLSGAVLPAGVEYAPIAYPADIHLADSRDVGVPVMLSTLGAHVSEPFVVIAGYSEGTLVADKVRGHLEARPSEAPSKLSFVLLASPFAGNGGIFNRFPGLAIPTIIDAMGPAQPTRYDSTYYAMMYDPYADFPAYFNPLSLANSALAILYAHPDAYYDAVEPGVTPAYVTTVDDNGKGGTDTYVLIYNPHLPLLAPLRELARATNTSEFAEPLIGAAEPLLRVLVDMGYTDRVNAHPERITPFSFVTPQARILEALAAAPAAVAQGASAVVTPGHSPPPPDPLGNLTTVPAPPRPATQDRPVLATARADDGEDEDGAGGYVRIPTSETISRQGEEPPKDAEDTTDTTDPVADEDVTEATPEPAGADSPGDEPATTPDTAPDAAANAAA